jgi:hypothetical protein
VKKFFLSTLLFLLVGCAHYSPHSGSNRTIANVDFNNLSAKERLEEVMVHIRETAAAIPHAGNPRAYIFEHFLNRSEVIAKEINSSNANDLEDHSFVPAQLDIINKFLAFYSAHKAMGEAGIYINFSRIVEPDSQEIAERLSDLSRIMDLYYRELEIKGGISVTPEVKDDSLAQERLHLIQYLAHKVDNNYSDFISSERDTKTVNSFLTKYSSIKGADFSSLQSELVPYSRSRTFKKVIALLTTLELPDSGDISGSDDAFEKVMSVQLSAELIQHLTLRFAR